MKQKIYYTLKRTKMSPHIREQIVAVLTNPINSERSQVEIAKLAGIHRRTLWNYLTDELWEEIKRQRVLVVGDEINLLDKSILRRALEGDIAAAKLMYSRWDKERAEKKEKVGIAEILRELSC